MVFTMSIEIKSGRNSDFFSTAWKPQGSIIALLLHIIYTYNIDRNDIKCCSEYTIHYDF